MSTPAHLPRGTESDSLLIQVNIDNVLQIHNVLHRQELDVTAILLRAREETTLRQCGEDLISIDVTPMFQAKIDEIINIHWAHVAELQEATKRLREAARHYGFTDDDVQNSFVAHDEATPAIVDRAAWRRSLPLGGTSV
ncbi:hypothetical protein [Pseudonocardia phyllosphaerae]|uniref:hypothetical protein n=1 Tax=Pseudonocardia phyllosphaerae TaxID=3390502 RepID=UPI003978E309